MKFIKVTNRNDVYADGVHDDTKALQSCLDELKDGGTVYFPDGIYLISAALIFYSNQVLKFSDKAVILRSKSSEPVTRYLLASYSEPQWTGYEGTHDVLISGGVFDGNAYISEKSTLVNTVHCRNITIENSRFVNCAQWHFIEINSTENAIVRNCIFDGTTYTKIDERLFNEEVQLDRACEGSYGPVYNCDGTLIDFCKDGAVCRNIAIRNNIFKCAGFPAVGHHDDCPHFDIHIENNIFDGPSGLWGKSRGYLSFRSKVYDLNVRNNIFIAPEDCDSPNFGIVHDAPGPKALLTANNIFLGKISNIS